MKTLMSAMSAIFIMMAYAFAQTASAVRVDFGGVDLSYQEPSPNQYFLLQPPAVVKGFGSYWQPPMFALPAGTAIKSVILVSQVWVVSGVDGGACVAKWIKNYTISSTGFFTGGIDVVTGLSSPHPAGDETAIVAANGVDVPNPGDYYGLFLYCNGVNGAGTTIVIDGNPAHTFLSMAAYQ